MEGPLNLSGADTTGFEAADPGRYNGEVVRAEWVETKGGDNAKMPEGSPMFKLAVKLTDEDAGGAWAWGQWPIPDSRYEKMSKENKGRAAKMKGAFVKTLTGLGFSEEEVMSGEFEFDPDDLIGNEVVVQVGRQERRNDPGTYDNTIKRVLPAGSPTTAGQEAGIL